MLNGTGIPLEEGASGELLGQKTMFNQFDICNNVFAPEDCISHPVASGEKDFKKGREGLSLRLYQSLGPSVSQQNLPWVPIIPSHLWKALSDALSHFFFSAPV